MHGELLLLENYHWNNNIIVVKNYYCYGKLLWSYYYKNYYTWNIIVDND